MSNSDAAGRVIATDTVLSGDTKGTLSVRESSVLTIEGDHEGGIAVETGSTLIVVGTATGSVTVDSLATVIVRGDLVGAVDIRVAGTLLVDETGRLAGPVANRGSFRNRGMRVGPVEGREPDDQPGSTQTPDPIAGAPYNYRLPPR